MFSLKNHPFAVEAFFESSLVLSYAVAKKELQPLLPPCLELDILNDTYGFVAAAFVQTKDLRPKGFPAFMGNNFKLIGFRIFVRYKNTKGKKLRGLYILKSETDKKKMAFLGNIFTHYNYLQTDIAFKKSEQSLQLVSKKSDINVIIKNKVDDIALPTNSPFKDWKEARKFAGPLPFTFTFNSNTNEVLIIEGVRENWIPHPVEVVKHHIGFINYKSFKDIQLANAFIIKNIPYYWKKGKIELWKP